MISCHLWSLHIIIVIIQVWELHLMRRYTGEIVDLLCVGMRLERDNFWVPIWWRMPPERLLPLGKGFWLLKADKRAMLITVGETWSFKLEIWYF